MDNAERLDRMHDLISQLDPEKLALHVTRAREALISGEISIEEFAKVHALEKASHELLCDLHSEAGYLGRKLRVDELAQEIMASAQKAALEGIDPDRVQGASA